jgi:hypothetical protein
MIRGALDRARAAYAEVASERVGKRILPIRYGGSMRLRLGDVFTVPVDEARVGLGQVVAEYAHPGYFFFAVFEPVFSPDALPELGEVVTQPVALLALSMDAKVVAGHWVVVGNVPVAPDVPLPAYKETVGIPDRVFVVDHSGTRRRPARAGEAEWLPNRSVVAPVRLEKALRAKHGLMPWTDAYAALEPTRVGTTAHLFDS